VKEGLEKSVAGITVLVNPDKVCLVNFINFGILLTIKPLDIMR